MPRRRCAAGGGRDRPRDVRIALIDGGSRAARPQCRLLATGGVPALEGRGGRWQRVDGTFASDPRDPRNRRDLSGFGGDRDRVVFEGSAAVSVTDRVAPGADERRKPNNLSAFREDAFRHLLVAWLPKKHVALAAADARLGTIADRKDQRGPGLSDQVGF